MSRIRQTREALGKSGIAFFIGLALFLIFYLLSQTALLAVDLLVLLPLGAFCLFRFFRYTLRHSLWSVRNRLLIVYGLLGLLPVLLLFLLAGLASWALMSELAIYLATSALQRRIDTIQQTAETLRHVPPDMRNTALPQIAKGFMHSFPSTYLQVKDASGEHRFPQEDPPLDIPEAWGNVTGLLYKDGGFYGWSHYSDETQKVTVLAPLPPDLIGNLVPHLGIIALLETDTKENDKGEDVQLDFKDGTVSSKAKGTQHIPTLPPAMNRLDIPIAWASALAHYHLNSPGRLHHGALVVQSRPSAVFGTFFADRELLRGVLFDLVVAIGVIFLLVELVAVFIGVSLARRITGAVNHLSEGTRRVIHGDFTHRIPVVTQDQLGELSSSFNQMTVNLERLVSVEKEKERLQTEIEIAREVQSQLYPKEAPPRLGLKLTVRCDPARMVSGDYYDYQVVGAGTMAFALGDVAGKGISAALLMASLQSALRAQLANCNANDSLLLDAARVVSVLNQQIYASTAPEKYATFFLAFFEEKTHTLTYTNAGHLSPLLFRNGEVKALDSNGTVVGAFPWAKYDESSVMLSRGDLLVCYTDGITEPENAYGEMFGEERLIELVKKHSHQDDREIVRIILDAVRGWTGSPELQDDMTLLLARQVETT